MRSIRASRAAALACILMLGLAGILSAPRAAATAPEAATNWATALAPTPTHANGVLDTVSCPTSSWCMALGTFVRPDGSQLPGAVVRESGTWHRTAMTAPSRTTSSTLVAHDCSGPTRCLAIYRVQQFDTSRWWVESWDGHRWHTVTHLPWSAKQYVNAVVCADAAHCLVTLGAHRSFLRTGTGWRSVQVPAAKHSFGVVAGSCGAKDDCVLAEAQNRRGLAVMHWNGRRFSRVSVTTVQVHHYLDIERVSCRVPDACVVTATDDGNKDRPVIARWNGKHWSRIALPSSVRGALLDGACTHRHGCYFAGLGTPNSEYGTHPFLLSHVGTKWTVRNRRVLALDCTGEAFCVGSVPGNGGWSIIQLGGTRWHSRHVPNPAGYDATKYSSISCPTSTCVAVGGTDERRGVVFAHLAASGWRLQQVDGLDGDHGQLNAVSCDSPQDCWAGGAVTSSSDPLLYHYDGSAWQRDSASTGTSHLESIDGISCVSTTFCMALGDQGGGATVAIDSWNGTAWTAEDLNVSDFFPRDISCTSPNFCLAVGRASFGDDGMWWNGSTWHKTSGPSLDRVSCVSSTYCMATGRAESSSDPDTVAVWNGSSWSSRNYRAPGPAWDLHGVSCVAVKSCSLAGALYPNRGTTIGFSETLVNGSWHIHTARAGGEFDEFNAIACPSAGTCHAVGSFTRDSVNYRDVPIVGVLHQ